MISKYRNRAVFYATCALGLSVLFGYLVHKSQQSFKASDNLIALSIFVFFAAWAMWMLTSFALTRAKGYVRDFAGSLFIMFFILGFCFPIAPMLFPLYIIFALEDKAKDRKRK